MDGKAVKMFWYIEIVAVNFWTSSWNFNEIFPIENQFF